MSPARPRSTAAPWRCRPHRAPTAATPATPSSTDRGVSGTYGRHQQLCLPDARPRLRHQRRQSDAVDTAATPSRHGAQTDNQPRSARVLDRRSPTATGDLGTVLNALNVLSTARARRPSMRSAAKPTPSSARCSRTSGDVHECAGQQMAKARGSSAGPGQHQAWRRPARSRLAMARARWAHGPVRSVPSARCRATPKPPPSPTTSAASRPASTIASARFLVGLGAGYNPGTQ